MSGVPGYLADAFWQTPGDDIFVRPDWEAIRQAITNEFAEGDRATAWRFAVDRWVQMTVDVLNEMLSVSQTRRWPYRVDRSQHFIFISPYGEEIGGELPTLGEGFRSLARKTLGPRIASDPAAGYPVFIFHDPHVAQNYLHGFGVNAFEIAGVCLGGEPQHIVLHATERLKLRVVLIHELNHAVLHALPLPLWIHEGLSRYFENKLLAMANMYYRDEREPGRNRFWRENGLKDFWSGAVFYDRRATMGYVLAHRFIHSLQVRDPEGFTTFLSEAHRRDAGDAACRKAFGHSLLQLTQELLGKGEWTGPGEYHQQGE